MNHNTGSSRDEEGVEMGADYKVNSQKNQSNFSQMMTGQYW